MLEAIEMATNLLYDAERNIAMDFSMVTFKTLAKLACTDILILAHKGYIRQVEGLGMGNSIACPLANIFMSGFDTEIKGNSTFYRTYVDDLIRIIDKAKIKDKLASINKLHPNLSFTMETEESGTLPFLDMKLIHNKNGTVESEWYVKPTDAGLTLNYHAMAPAKYKKAP